MADSDYTESYFAILYNQANTDLANAISADETYTVLGLPIAKPNYLADQLVSLVEGDTSSTPLKWQPLQDQIDSAANAAGSGDYKAACIDLIAVIETIGDVAEEPGITADLAQQAVDDASATAAALEAAEKAAIAAAAAAGQSLLTLVKWTVGGLVVAGLLFIGYKVLR